MTIDEMNARRREYGLTYEMIATLSGVPVGTVQKVLGGITKSPRKETISKLERTLSIDGTGALSMHDGGVHETERLVMKRQGEYTVEDYIALPDDQRYELIDGVLYGMAAPTATHQEIIGEVYFAMRSYIKNNKGPCKAYLSPFDVQLDMDDRTMVQPDVMVICDKSKIYKGKRLLGSPDFVCEVLSPSSIRKDMLLKYKKYKAAGVREYWIIDPELRQVNTYDFETGISGIYGFDCDIPVAIYGGKCTINLSNVENME